MFVKLSVWYLQISTASCNIIILLYSLQSCPFYIKKSNKPCYNVNVQNFIVPASLFTQYGCRWFFAMLSCTKLTTSGLIGALKIAGKEMVVPNGSFLSLYTLIRGRAADRDWNKNHIGKLLQNPYFINLHIIKHDLLDTLRSLAQ